MTYKRVIHYVALVLLVLLAISIGRGSCERAESKLLEGMVTRLEAYSDDLNSEIIARGLILTENEARIEELRDSLGSSDVRYMRLERTYVNLEEEYDSLKDSVQTIPVDSSYEFLQTEAYPLEGELKYPFNEPQVKAIHLTFLEGHAMVGMNAVLHDKINELALSNLLRDSVSNEYLASVALLKADTADLRTIIDNKDLIIDGQAYHIKTRRKRDRAWKVVGGIVIGILTAIAIGSG